ncbi:unnamed protein product, partial [Polarella glacialis]
MKACQHTGLWAWSLQLLSTAAREKEARPDDLIYTYNYALSSLSRAGLWQHALGLLAELLANGQRPDSVSFSCVIDACSRKGVWLTALRILDAMPRYGVQQTTRSYNAAIAACAEAGEWRAALWQMSEMWDSCAVPDSFTFGHLVVACERSRQWQQALCLLQDARSHGVEVDLVMVSCAVSAACSEGLVVVVVV